MSRSNLPVGGCKTCMSNQFIRRYKIMKIVSMKKKASKKKIIPKKKFYRYLYVVGNKLCKKTHLSVIIYLN